MAGKTASRREKLSALDKGLKGLFRVLQGRPVPDRLRSVVDQLDEGDAEPPRKQSQA